MKPQLAIVGTGGHARVVLDAVRTEGKAEIWGCVDDDPSRHGQCLDGAVIHGGLDVLFRNRDAVDAVVVAVGSNADRFRLAEEVIAHGFPLARVIHGSAIVADETHIGSGTVVMAGAVVQPGAHVGSLVIINTAATVDHDCVVEDGAHLGPGVHLGGNVHVGAGVLLGIGTVVLPGVCIGDRCVVGAGSVAVRDLPPNKLAFGVPATIRREVDP